MKDEIAIRKQAVEFYLQGISAMEIAQKVGKSRQCAHKWINRFKQGENANWFESQSTAPKGIELKIASNIEQTIVNIRRQMESNKYAQKGALNILYEFKRLGLEPPSIATINRVLKRNGLIGKSIRDISKKKNIRTCLSMSNKWI